MLRYRGPVAFTLKGASTRAPGRVPARARTRVSHIEEKSFRAPSDLLQEEHSAELYSWTKPPAFPTRSVAVPALGNVAFLILTLWLFYRFGFWVVVLLRGWMMHARTSCKRCTGWSTSVLCVRTQVLCALCTCGCLSHIDSYLFFFFFF